MKNFNVIIGLLGFATICTSSAMATDERSYGLVSVGVTPMAEVGTTTTSLGLSLGGGYNYNKYFGVEGQLALLGQATTNTLNATALALTINGYLPVQVSLQLFVKAGKAYTAVSDGKPTASASQSAFTNVYGYGLEYSSSDKRSYRFGVDHYELSVLPGITLSTNYINVAVIYNY